MRTLDLAVASAALAVGGLVAQALGSGVSAAAAPVGAAPVVAASYAHDEDHHHCGCRHGRHHEERDERHDEHHDEGENNQRESQDRLIVVEIEHLLG
jgi:hypothetical protein